MFSFTPSSLQYCIQLALIALSALATLTMSTAHGVQSNTILVTTATPGIIADGQCSLAEAITNANADAATTADCTAGSGADVIVLAANATYTLAAVNNTTDGANGLPSITSDITIMGNGASVERSNADGTPEFRIFHVAANGALRLHELTVANGVARGQDGLNPTDGVGGGIYSRGTITAENSVVRDNMAVGGNFIDESGQRYGNGGNGFGGGIDCIDPDSYTVHTVILTNTLISNNRVVGGEGWSGGYVLGGGIVCGAGTTLIINDSVIEGNTANGGKGSKENTSNFGASAFGGGLFIGGAQLLRFTNTVIQHNQAIGGNSAANSDINGGRPGQGAGGGAYIENSNASNGNIPEVRNVAINHNTASSGMDGFGRTDPQLSYGGGIALESSDVNIITSWIHDNHAEGKGGGISATYYSHLNLTSSTISGNAAQQGGGMAMYGYGTLYMRNSTVSGNSAVRGGGIMDISDQDTFGNTFAWNSTISFNRASESGGGLVNDSVVQGNAGARLYNSIVSNNVAGDCSSQNSGVASGGYNLDSDGSCGFGAGVGDMPHTDPHLGPLQDNGGPTWTHALLPGSPAIDRIDDTGCRFDYNNELIAEDQRGVARPQGAACDIGAYEAEQSSVTLTAMPSATPTAPTTSVPTPTTQPTNTPPPKNQRVLLPLITN